MSHERDLGFLSGLGSESPLSLFPLLRGGRGQSQGRLGCLSTTFVCYWDGHRRSTKLGGLRWVFLPLPLLGIPPLLGAYVAAVGWRVGHSGN